MRLLILIALFCHIHFSQAQKISISPVGRLESDLSKISSIAFSSDSEMMVASDQKGKFQVWDLNASKIVTTGNLSAGIVFVDFLRKDEEILVVDKNGNLLFADTKDYQNIRKIKLDDIPVLVTTDPEKQFLSYVNKDGVLKIFNLKAQMLQASIDINNRIQNAMYLGYDRFGQQLAVMGLNGNTIICNPVNQKVIRETVFRSDEFSGSASVMHAGASNKGSDLFVTGVQEVFIPKGGVQDGQPERRNSIVAYDWDSSQEVKKIRVNNRVDRIVLGPGPSQIVCYTEKRFELSLIDLTRGELSSQVTLSEFPEAIQISDDDNYLASGDKKGTIHLFELLPNSAPQIKIIKPSLNRGYSETLINNGTADIEGVLSDGSKVKKVTINGIESEILQNGKFKSSVELIPGKNRVRVLAEDYQSNTSFKDFYITREVDFSSAKPKSSNYNTQKRVALVIGNADYSEAAALNNTVNDANAISSTLKELGFEVNTVLNGTYEDIKRAIYKYGSDIQDVDVSIFFYAGHGLEIDGINYLVPVDAEINSALDVKLNTVPLTGVINTVRYANDDGLNMLILDACRNNPFPTGKRGGAGLAKESAPSGTLIAYSTSPGNVASDGTGENGLYTGELVKQLKVPQRIEDVFMQTRNRVEEISNGTQRPWEEARLRGIFYLKYE
ncbi:MAG: caspase family protein [Cyclobacteriaceae bacterium]